MNQTLGRVECEHGHKNHPGILNDIKAPGWLRNIPGKENRCPLWRGGCRLAHGVCVRKAKHELAVVLVGAVADHLVLGRGVDVAQAFL